MKLLIVLICIGIQRYLNIRFSLPEMDWFKPYRALVNSTLGKSGLMKGYVGLAILVLPIAVLVWILNAILGGNLIIGLIIGVAVLFYCLDARDQSKQISNYLSGGKTEKGKTADEELKTFLKGSLPITASEQARAVSSKIVLWSQHHVFSVLFWYMLFGVFGAVVYFLVHRIVHEAAHKDSDVAEYSEASQVVQSIMDWVPVRLAGLSFGAVGAFGALLNQWMKNIAGGLDLQQKLPLIFGLSALNADVEKSDKANVEENQGLLGLVFKAELVWVVAIALITLIGLI
jgi:membrane protein required for beta-lactamase induction